MSFPFFEDDDAFYQNATVKNLSLNTAQQDANEVRKKICYGNHKIPAVCTFAIVGSLISFYITLLTIFHFKDNLNANINEISVYITELVESIIIMMESSILVILAFGKLVYKCKNRKIMKSVFEITTKLFSSVVFISATLNLITSIIYNNIEYLQPYFYTTVFCSASCGFVFICMLIKTFCSSCHQSLHIELID